MTNTTVSTTNATSAPRLSRLRARQHQRARLDPRRQLEERDDRTGEGHRADEHADEHLGVVDAQDRVGDLGLVRALGLDAVVAVPADQHRGETDEAVQHRDQLGHAGHLDAAGPPAGRSPAPMTIATTSSPMPVAAMLREASPMVATSAMAMPPMPKTMP